MRKAALADTPPRMPISRPNGLQYLSMHHFEAQIGTTFHASHGYTELDLDLDSVTDLATPEREGEPVLRGEAFLLRFSGRLDRKVSQDVYKLEHRRLGNLALLLVPGGLGNKGLVYEAVVNRRTP